MSKTTCRVEEGEASVATDLTTTLERLGYEQREWLRVTLTSIGEAVIATDAVARITFLNPVAELLTGWKTEEAIGQPVSCVFRMVNEQTGQPMEEAVARVLREGCAVPLANRGALDHEGRLHSAHRGRRDADHGRRGAGHRVGTRVPRCHREAAGRGSAS